MITSYGVQWQSSKVTVAVIIEIEQLPCPLYRSPHLGLVANANTSGRFRSKSQPKLPHSVDLVVDGNRVLLNLSSHFSQRRPAYDFHGGAFATLQRLATPSPAATGPRPPACPLFSHSPPELPALRRQESLAPPPFIGFDVVPRSR